jgi:hypothetical protein
MKYAVEIGSDAMIYDEAHSELSGSVNRQHMRHWSDNNPRRLHGKPLHSERVTVWCGISAVGITGSYFLRMKMDVP